MTKIRIPEKFDVLKRTMRDNKFIFLFFIPTLVFMGIFSYYPVFSEIYYSFYKWDGVNLAFVGLGNYIKMLYDQNFISSINNMILLLTIRLLLSIIFPFLGAYIVYQVENRKIQYLYRVLFIIPMVVNLMVMILLWQFIYDRNVGVLNQFLKLVGMKEFIRSWLGERSTSLFAIALLGFPWITSFGYGLYFLIYSAGLDNISPALHDAANIDGVGNWTKLLYIDLPLMRGQIKLVVILTIINTIQYFVPILVMTQGGPGTRTMVPALVMFFNAFRFDNMGYASAMGFVLFLVIFMLSWFNIKYLKGMEI